MRAGAFVDLEPDEQCNLLALVELYDSKTVAHRTHQLVTNVLKERGAALFR